MNRFFWLIIILFMGFSINAKSQKPLQPPADSIYLSISDLTTGNPTIFWAAPPFNPLNPDPTGYIIYQTVHDAFSPPEGRNEEIARVGPTVRSYPDLTKNGNNKSLTYLIASEGPTEPSQLSTKHSTIFITSEYDSCNHILNLRWNTYKAWGSKLEKYDIYISNSPPPASFTLYGSLPWTKNDTIIKNVVENQDYYVYVEAKKINKSHISRSNLFHKRTTMPIHPTSMTIDSIIAEDSKTNIYFKIDPNTELTKFQVVRWEHPDSVKSIFSRKILHTFSKPTETFYADTVDSWTARTRPFYYKIDALNTCSRIVKVSNHTNAITPNALAGKGMKNIVEWDELYVDKAITERKDNLVKYNVIRYAYTTSPLPPLYLPETDQITLTDDVKELEGDGYSIKFCYQIEASERNMLGELAMFSRSRIQCVEIIPGVIMPDAIIPTDYTSNFGKPRNILAPTITFLADYTISVYNRWGNLIFYGENKGWNGYFSNGELANEGTYIYRLVVHTAGNKDVIKEGSFVVIYK